MLDTGRQKGRCKILGKADPQEIGRTDRNIGIAGEIEIDLKGEQHGTKPSKIGAVWSDIEDIVDDGGKTVRQHHLFHKAQHDKTEPEHEQPMPPPLVIEDSLYLRERLIGPNDGSGNQLRKKRFEEEELAERTCWSVATAYDIDVIGQRLKTVERDAERQCKINIAARWARFPEQHVSVFEVPDQPDIDDDRGHDATSVGRNNNLDQPVECDRAQKHQHVEWSGRRVKYQARHNQHQRAQWTDRHPSDGEGQQ